MNKRSKVLRAVVMVVFVAVVGLIAATLSGCRQSDRVAYNISREADSFGVTRKLTVLNIRSDKVLMELTGTFSIANNSANELEVICKTGEDEYKKHFVYLNQWTVYTVEDISGADVSAYNYEIVFYPRMLPIIEGEVEW